jgi:predicted RNA binding protein YcfA (HicA-like mRNA interferase family)
MTPRLPRDLSGHQLATALAAFGYRISRQTGSHLRLTTSLNGEHHVTVPIHDHLKLGTLSGILTEVARHLDLSRDDVQTRLFG